MLLFSWAYIIFWASVPGITLLGDWDEFLPGGGEMGLSFDL
jgi:hypothetical protein